MNISSRVTFILIPDMNELSTCITVIENKVPVKVRTTVLEELKEKIMK